ncbi:MAG: YibE/F family protein [Bacillota bacterium]|jgi:uncharacterized membrane protein|nr:YibE/F family protein [Bacillota bacterium]
MKKKQYRLRLSTFMIVTIFFILIMIGNKVFSESNQYFTADNNLTALKAKVTEITDRNYHGGSAVLFKCKLLNGDHKGSIVEGVQFTDSYLGESVRLVEKGDRICLGDATSYDMGVDWFLYEYERFSGIVWLGLAFAVLLLIFGRTKGLTTVISIAYTIMTIFLVFIPAILSGYNIYLSAVTLCIFITLMSLFIVQGPNAKCYAAILGCLGGLFMISVITLTMSSILKITGLISEESLYLIQMDLEHPIDLKAVVFASVTIGAMGAVLDIAVDIVAALSELYRYDPEITFKKTMQSGIVIGRDIVGSMSNTLILAYIGSSLSLILLVLVNTGGITEMLNSELIIVEILQALAGSIGILFTIPLSALSYSFLCSRKSS